jgi:DNA-binding transcriptional ArsR family regulator
MSGTVSAAHAASAFSALGDPFRLAIMERLCADGPLPTAKLGDSGHGVTRQGLTKHLRVLEEAGLVESYRAGRDRQWQARSEQLATVRAYLDQVAREWDERLLRLQALVTEDSEKPGAGPSSVYCPAR